MCLKLLRTDFSTLKQGLLTMPVQKFGRINLMIPSLIFGHLDVLYMKWQHLNLHSELKTWMDYIRKSSRDLIKKLETIFPKLYPP